MLALYVNKFDLNKIGETIDSISERIGSTHGSLEMQGRMIVHLANESKGLPHSGFALRFAMEKFGTKSEKELREYILRILNETPNEEDKRNTKTYLMRRRVEMQERKMNNLYF
jgi:hypothetical protein